MPILQKYESSLVIFPRHWNQSTWLSWRKRTENAHGKEPKFIPRGEEWRNSPWHHKSPSSSWHVSANPLQSLYLVPTTVESAIRKPQARKSPANSSQWLETFRNEGTNIETKDDTISDTIDLNLLVFSSKCPLTLSKSNFPERQKTDEQKDLKKAFSATSFYFISFSPRFHFLFSLFPTGTAFLRQKAARQKDLKKSSSAFRSFCFEAFSGASFYSILFSLYFTFPFHFSPQGQRSCGGSAPPVQYSTGQYVPQPSTLSNMTLITYCCWCSNGYTDRTKELHRCAHRSNSHCLSYPLIIAATTCAPSWWFRHAARA